MKIMPIRAQKQGQGKGQRKRAIPLIHIDRKRFPTATNLNTFMRTKTPPIKWAVEGLIPEGLTIIAAGKSIGKTMLALNIGIAVADGKPVLGKLDAEQGPVLYEF